MNKLIMIFLILFLCFGCKDIKYDVDSVDRIEVFFLPLIIDLPNDTNADDLREIESLIIEDKIRIQQVLSIIDEIQMNDKYNSKSNGNVITVLDFYKDNQLLFSLEYNQYIIKVQKSKYLNKQNMEEIYEILELGWPE